MRIERHKIGSVDVVLPGGPLVDEEIADFESAVRPHLQEPSPHVVLGLQQVSYIDSQGLEALVGLARELRGRSLPLKVAGLTPTCREILELTELTGEFEIFDEVQDAVRSFA